MTALGQKPLSSKPVPCGCLALQTGTRVARGPHSALRWLQRRPTTPIDKLLARNPNFTIPPWPPAQARPHARIHAAAAVASRRFNRSRKFFTACADQTPPRLVAIFRSVIGARVVSPRGKVSIGPRGLGSRRPQTTASYHKADLLAQQVRSQLVAVKRLAVSLEVSPNF